MRAECAERAEVVALKKIHKVFDLKNNMPACMDERYTLAGFVCFQFDLSPTKEAVNLHDREWGERLCS